VLVRRSRASWGRSKPNHAQVDPGHVGLSATPYKV